MSKINQAIHEIHHIDSSAMQEGWLNRVHPLAKLLLTFFYVLIVVSFDKYDLSGLLSMLLYLIITMFLEEISFALCVKRLKAVMLLVCLVGVANPFFDRTVVGQIGGLAVTGGVVSMLMLMLKGICALVASYILVMTTSIERICYALRLLHVPKIIVTIVMLIYRYIIVFMKEIERITNAYSMRAPKQKGIHYKAWGTLVGQLLLRSVDRAQNVYESMTLRGYNGEYYVNGEQNFEKYSVVYMLAWAIVFVIFRMVPVFHIIGSLFM